MYRGGGLRLSASVAPGVSGSEWYWPVVGSAYSGVGQCGCASPGEWTDGQLGGLMDWLFRNLGLLH